MSLTARVSPRRMDARNRRRLSPAETAASVALTQAQLDGQVVNAKPFARGGAVQFRVELVVEAARVEALLRALNAPDALAEPEPAP